MFNVEFEEVTNQFCAEFGTVVHVSDANLGTKTITANDTYYAEDDGYDGYSEVTVNVSGGGGSPTLETITKTYTPTTSQQTEQITPSSGYDGIAEVDVTVNAMPTGTEGTPTATKGAVSNHSVNVTPSVTNVAGYIAGGTKTGTAVTVSASELVSGTKSITANGNNQDVVGYAAVNVAVPNSYSAGDEGKVVSSGALVAQTAHSDVTPTTSDQTIDTTLNNSLKVKGDADLVAGNIKKDVEIFGVTGSYEGGGSGISIDDLATNTAPSGAITLSSSVTQIGELAFAGKPVTSVTGTGVTNINGNAFNGSSVVEITDSNFPNLNEFAVSACAYMPSLKRVYLTGAKAYLKNLYTFQNNNNSIKVARFPNCTGVTAQQNFGSCYQLKVLDLGPVDSINSNFAYNARGLQTLILRKTTVCALNNVSGFTNTPLRGYGSLTATIYIPKALYDHLGDGSSSDYRAATNWSTIYGEGHITFAQLEGSPYEQTNWDDTPFLS